MKKLSLLVVLTLLFCCFTETPASALFKKRHRRSGEEN
ncbi:MAG: hypothetical protein ACD_39C01948G0001, partial [uncultured bacterium]